MKENQPRKSLTIKSSLGSHMSITDNGENKKSRSLLKTINNLDGLNSS